MRYGALEAGGTKMVCAIGDEHGNILEQCTFPTLTPEETMPGLIRYFAERNIEALGIGAFGPVDVVPGSATFGRILNTPKLAWRNFNIVEPFEKELGVPVGLDTDVNAACLGEAIYGAAKGLSDVVYLTIGTGIGAGIYSNGKLVHGMLHPEGGHILLQKHPADPGECICPCHSHCLEGLASGPAIEKRWGKKADALADCKEVWEFESDYLAQGLINFLLILSPQRIILGGGVMHQEQLFPLVRQKVAEKLNGYYTTAELEQLDTYIVPAGLAGTQGIMGCLYLAQKCEKRNGTVTKNTPKDRMEDI